MFLSVLEAWKDVSYWPAGLAGVSKDIHFPQRGGLFSYCTLCNVNAEGGGKGESGQKS